MQKELLRKDATFCSTKRIKLDNDAYYMNEE